MKVHIAWWTTYDCNEVLGIYRSKAGAWERIADLPREVRGPSDDFIYVPNPDWRFSAYVGEQLIGCFPTAEDAQAALDTYDYADFGVKDYEVGP